MRNVVPSAKVEKIICRPDGFTEPNVSAKQAIEVDSCYRS